MRIFIDATRPAPELPVFGMTLLERLLRAVRDAGVEPREVRIELARGGEEVAALPQEILDALPLRWCPGDEPVAARLAAALRSAGGDPVVALSADTVVDSRVVSHLCRAPGSIAFQSGEGEEQGAALRLESEVPGLASAGDDLLAAAECALRSGAAKPFAESDFDPYITMLRRTLAPYLFRIVDAPARDRVERSLFWSNYKGSTDFLTKHVYPPLVWAMVRPLARWRVHPNWVTAVDWVAAFAAVPLFAFGAWLPGIALGYLMSVLDSVDGKLARLSYTSSRFGEIFDHALDIVHPPAWYMAWGFALGGGNLASLPFQASLWMFGFYVADRLCATVFKARHGCSIHGYTPLDEKVRTYISRRNVNLAIFTVALLFDWVQPGYRVAEYTFHVLVLWQVACFAWHAERIVQFWNAPDLHRG